MKKLFKVSLITLLLAITLVTMGAGAVIAAPSDIQMVVTVNGLEKGDEATLTLSLSPGIDPAEKPLLKQTIKGSGEKSLTVDIVTSLKDGYYQLLLEAPEKYFREPKGYLFAVNQSQIVNPVGRAIVFDLIPPSARTYEPYRESTGTLNDGTTYMAEALISLSAPMKQLQPSGGTILSTGYHYIGPITTQDNTGVHGHFDVTNPGVVHDETNNQFVVDRVMARNDAGNKWIEIGWAEVSWESDARWMYEFDSKDHTWYFYSLPTGSSLEVKVEKFSGTTWKAYYKNSGGSWVSTRTPNIGISTAGMAENRGEVYTQYASHPNLPSTTTDTSMLKVGSWDEWDTTYSNSTTTNNDGPYDTHYTYQYHFFYIHTH